MIRSKKKRHILKWLKSRKYGVVYKKKFYEFNKDLLWYSDWNGDEVGYDEAGVVGFYRIKGTDVHMYIDMENLIVLESFIIEDEIEDVGE